MSQDASTVNNGDNDRNGTVSARGAARRASNSRKNAAISKGIMSATVRQKSGASAVGGASHHGMARNSRPNPSRERPTSPGSNSRRARLERTSTAPMDTAEHSPQTHHGTPLTR